MVLVFKVGVDIRNNLSKFCIPISHIPVCWFDKRFNVQINNL